MYDKCYFCLDQLPKLKKESTASFFVNFGGAGVQKSRPTLLYSTSMHIMSQDATNDDDGYYCWPTKIIVAHGKTFSWLHLDVFSYSNVGWLFCTPVPPKFTKKLAVDSFFNFGS